MERSKSMTTMAAGFVALITFGLGLYIGAMAYVD